MISRRSPSSVILVREWEGQMSSSGCCGRLEGDFLNRRGKPCFPERRRDMEAAGVLYQALRQAGGVEVHVVDPRNLLALIPCLIRDFYRHGVGARDALRTLFGLSVTSVVVNGRLVSRGRWPTAESLLRHVDQA